MAPSIGSLRGLRRRWKRPDNDPETFSRRGRGPGTRYVVACVGDSITHGVAGADYVTPLRRRFGPLGYEFVNAGINGNLAYNVLQRLDPIIACRPDAVTLLIGTNDVNATFNQTWEAFYRDQQALPQGPTLDWYRQNVEQIVARLQAETDADLVILDLPPLGEDPASEMNRRVATYNAALREIAAAAHVPCLPLNERLTRLLPPGHTPPPYDGDMNQMATSVFRHYVLRHGWDRVSTDRGLAILTDHIHLNDAAASVIVDLIAGYLNTKI